MNDTVYALSTPTGGAIALLRMSGPKTAEIMYRIFSAKLKDRYAAVGYITDPRDGGRLDQAVVTAFFAPRSYTGEDMAEICLHGGQAVVNGVAAALELLGAKPAGPGEFTKRAFLAGKLDLSQAEAVADLVAATARRSAEAAVSQLEGKLKERIIAIETAVTDALAGIDAAIDYPEELEDDVYSGLFDALREIAREMDGLIDTGMNSQFLREGASVVIAGKPNAGKSSLMNALLGTDRAIVTDIPGTTRDIITEQMEIEGLPVRLTDTAGLHSATDKVEKIGIERARKAMESADILILAFDSGLPLTDEEHKLIKETAQRKRIAALCKSDGVSAISPTDFADDVRVISVSAVTGQGIDGLKSAIAMMISPEQESPVITNRRHVNALVSARAALLSAQRGLRENFDWELIATDLRECCACISEITGSKADEQVIDRIFSKFCVGK